jgi:hypothetical protein
MDKRDELSGTLAALVEPFDEKGDVNAVTCSKDGAKEPDHQPGGMGRNVG